MSDPVALDERQGEGRRELRIAIVCYGGVSLCIYMHGSTKELHRLVKASRLAGSANGDANALSPSERVYAELLSQESGPRIDVVVDVITGTSAGGINGIFLAKALAQNLPQDGLRELWFDKGDIKKLVRGPRRLPLWARLPIVLSQIRRKPPLRGDDMSVWLYGALAGMDEAGPSPATVETLMPDGHELQLFVTMTDFYGYDRQVATSDPTLVHDRRHRHVFEFAYGEDQKRFTSADNLALAFAARATSCFPGAFPPVSVPLFRSYLPEASGELEQTFFRLYELSGAEVDKTYFVDGGVLDNRPFGYAIDAIRKKRAEVEVERRLLYLEPDPGTPTPAPQGETPGTISAVLGAVSGIPRREPILDDLLEVARLNERVRRMQDVIVASFGKIAHRLDGIVGDALEAGSEPDAETLAEWQRRINEDARKDAGMAYETYVRSKISGVVDRLATTACAVCTYPSDANHAFLVRSVYRFWAEQKSLFRQDDDGADGPSQAQLEFLRDFDLDYGIRRLQFVLAGVNWLYRDVGKAGVPPRAELDAVKARLWEAIDRLRDAMSGRNFTPELDAGLSGCFPVKDVTDFIRAAGFAPAEYVAQREQQLDALERDLRTFLGTDLQGFSAELYRDMIALTAGWDPARRRDMLVRYLGFPFWDILLYPIQSVADAGERDEVKIVRMSPLDTDLLRVPNGKPKLEGIGINHFKAFFAREYRENDYLWGRLDAAERLIGIVIGKDDPAYRAWCARAFRAILDEEGEALTLVPDLVADVRGQVEQLAG